LKSPYCFFARLPGRQFTQLLLGVSVFVLAACEGNTARVIEADTTVVQTQSVVVTQDGSVTQSIGAAPEQENLGVCVDTPPIGDGWGWDGTASCRIVTGNNTIESDTTEQPVQSAGEVVAGVTAPGPGGITDLILITGQSNALGANTTFDAELDAPNDRVFAYTDQGWQVANLNQVWDLGLFPRNGLGSDPSNNFGLHFGKRLAERRSDRVVGIVLITAPGEAISHWDSDGLFFSQTRDKVSRAINDLPFKSAVDAILWHQGESDGSDDDQYGTALYSLISNFRSEPWFEFGFPFICGETATLPVNRQLQRLNTDNDPWTACIEAEGLATDDGGFHFTAESLRTMGERYADEYIDLFLGG